MSYIPINIDSAITKECVRRGYSRQTAKTYLYCIHKFLDLTKKDLGKTSKLDARHFLEHLSDKGLAGNTMNTYHMAIRFLFEEVLDKKMWIDVKYSKIPEKLPVFLTKEELTKLFDAIKNPRHKLMAQLTYSAGLRVSELINLHIKDLDVDKGYGFVRRGKGNKDRIFIISEKLKLDIKALIGSADPERSLFTNNRGERYCVRTLQQILKQAKSRAKLEKRVTPHVLRHSFATHLIENGYAVTDVQSLLGHKSPETTQIYLHTAAPNLIKIKSPFDEL